MTSFERNGMVFDALLKVAVSEAYAQEIAALPGDEELNGCQPSPVLDRRIAGVIRSGYRRLKARHLVKGLGKAAAILCILLTVSSAVLLSVGATRNAILNAIVKWHDTYTEIQFGDSSEDGVYRPAWLPAGFAEKSTDVGNNFTTIIYSNDSGERIIFDQQKAGAGTTLVDNENKDYTEVKIAGVTGHLFKAKTENDSSILVWEIDGVVFELISAIDSKELIQIGESIKK